jgi:3-oxoacyl-[acyl-carrier protein] reductase
MDLTGKKAIVVGGGQGIGETSARMLTARGARVAIADIRPERAERVASSIEGGLAIACDATDSAQVNACVLRVTEAFDGLDYLVMSVSPDSDDAKRESLRILGRLAEEGSGLVPAEPNFDMTRHLRDDQWHKELQTVLYSVFYFTRAALDVMIPQRRGSIVSLSSIHAIAGYPGFSHYSAAKAGVVGFTRAVAREVGPYNIRINAITAGYVMTPLSREMMPQAFKNSTAKLTPLGRMGEPEEIASVVCFLCSDESSFITGQAISPNGGILTVPS